MHEPRTLEANDTPLMREAHARRSARRQARRAGVIALGKSCGWHWGHAVQVARLARQLYAQIPPPGEIILRPGPADEWLEYAALLHDIGYIIDIQKHHKHAERLIREAKLPGLLPHEATIIALVVRCHRKRWPGPTHAVFRGLGQADYLTVQWLTALLRVADGLDRTHMHVVRKIIVSDVARYLDIGLVVAGQPESELWAARKKSDLLESVLGHRVLFRVMARRTPSPKEQNHGAT